MTERTEYEVLFYTKADGTCLTDCFLDSLPIKARAKIEKWIELLEEEGPDLPRPYADVLRDKVRELRVKSGPAHYRLLYFFLGPEDHHHARVHQKDGPCAGQGDRPGPRGNGGFLSKDRERRYKDMKSMRKFRDRLREDLRDRKFKQAFDEEHVFARLAVEIAKAREEQGLSQKQVADRLHTTQQTVSRLENPHNRSFSLATLIKFAKVFRKNLEIHLV
jgi:DNA-binding XRE family transcriptional regulator/mRNA-degrading endonuclease RelE of RelBE toxin-antitoxin system